MLHALVTCLLLQTAAAPKTTIKLDVASAKPGAVITGKATVEMAEGLHTYQNPPSDEFQIPLKLSVVEKGFTLTKIDYPKGTELTMAGDEKPSKVYEGKIVIPFKLKTSKKAAQYKVWFRIDYQQCTASQCYPPANVVVKVPLKVAAK